MYCGARPVWIWCINVNATKHWCSPKNVKLTINSFFLTFTNSLTFGQFSDTSMTGVKFPHRNSRSASSRIYICNPAPLRALQPPVPLHRILSARSPLCSFIQFAARSAVFYASLGSVVSPILVLKRPTEVLVFDNSPWLDLDYVLAITGWPSIICRSQTIRMVLQVSVKVGESLSQSV